MLPLSIRSLSILFAVSLAPVLLGADRARAETPAGLAAPGPCAEPREALTGVVPGGDAEASVGSLAALFSPADVAAAPAAPARPQPAAGPSGATGACDVLAANCGLQPEPVPAKNPPIVPGPGRPLRPSEPKIDPGGPKTKPGWPHPKPGAPKIEPGAIR